MNLPTAYIDDYRDAEGFSLLTGYQAGTGSWDVVIRVQHGSR